MAAPRAASTRSPRGPRRSPSWARPCARCSRVPDRHPPSLSAARPVARPRFQVRSLRRLIERAWAAGLVRPPESHGRAASSPPSSPPRSAPTITAASGVYCVVTDVDINRAWVPLHPETSRRSSISPRASGPSTACAPTASPASRSSSPASRSRHELLGGAGPDRPAQATSPRRLVRLDRKGVFRAQARGEIHHFLGDLPADQETRPPLLTYTVGGAGAQADLARLCCRACGR